MIERNLPQMEIQTLAEGMEVQTLAEDMEIQITQSPVVNAHGEYTPVLNANIPIKSIRKFKEQRST